MVWWPFATKPERAATLEVTDLHSVAPPLYSTTSFENTARRGLGQFKQNPSMASFQHGVLESIYESFVKSGYSRIFIPSNLFGQISPCRP
jgi:hypothetical protein